MFGIILAGGSGSRLWPMSRELYPKQLLHLYSEKSLLQSTFERINTFIPDDKIICVTNKNYYQQVKMQLNAPGKSPMILAENHSRNTAPAIILALKNLGNSALDDDIILVVPTDLQINDNDKFIK